VALVEKGKLERCGSAGAGTTLLGLNAARPRPVRPLDDRASSVSVYDKAGVYFKQGQARQNALATRSGWEPDREGGDEVLLSRYGSVRQY